MTGPIICGVDDSQSAKAAARVARLLASELHLGVIFVRVLEPGAPATRVSAITERLERLHAGTSEVDGGAAWCVAAGHPADELVAAAKKPGASMIVIGSSGLRFSSLGSVCADLSRRASCPVVVVLPEADARVNGHRGELAGGLVRFGPAATSPDRVRAGSGRA